MSWRGGRSGDRHDTPYVGHGGCGAGSAKLEYQGETIETAEVQASSDGSYEVVYVTNSGKRVPEEEVGPLAYALR